MKHLLFLFACYCMMMPHLAFSQNVNEATEPSVKGPEVIDLLAGGTLNAWKVPSAHWRLEGGSVIVGESGTEKLTTPEWIYTKQRFSNFEFTCELKLTGDNRRNTGIYYRVTTVSYRGRFEAPSGYEFDAAATGDPLTGSVGDWYVRPSLRISADSAIINKVYNSDNWNRMTLRARGNRLEYWINGIKVMDYQDPDPSGSREGIIGFQMHDGSVMKVQYRNIRVLPLK
ncbi:MAG: DUF1080 domain-containing protein [Bacteroidia bacterium]|nr:DUF1080 domain-containing protein [Bacteroidia bacterium]